MMNFHTPYGIRNFGVLEKGVVRRRERSIARFLGWEMEGGLVGEERMSEMWVRVQVTGVRRREGGGGSVPDI